MHSHVYVGQVRHRRFAPRAHAFGYPLFMLYLDLAELPAVFRRRWLWSVAGPAPARFRRADHLGDARTPLDEAVRALVAEHGGRRPEGPIRLLTHLRYFGYYFSPINIYYCFDAAGAQVEAIVAEVSNTPWGERHCYVLHAGLDRGQGGHHRYLLDKDFPVSPFMPMDMGYDLRFDTPDQRLHVHMQSTRAGIKIFDATLRMQRRPLTGAVLAGLLLRFPFMTGRVIVAIYYQALRLWLKGLPFIGHPGPSDTTLEAKQP